MTDKHTPVSRYFLTELNDGIQWLTDGQDFGMNAASVPELLEALEYLEKEATLLLAHASCDDCTNHSVHGALAKARVAIKAAKGDA